MIDCKRIAFSLELTKAQQKAILSLIRKQKVDIIRIFTIEKNVIMTFKTEVELTSSDKKHSERKEVWYKLPFPNSANNEVFLINLTSNWLENFITGMKMMDCKLALNIRMYYNNASEWSENKGIQSQTMELSQQKGYSMMDSKLWSIHSEMFTEKRYDEFFYTIRIQDSWTERFYQDDNAREYLALDVKEPKIEIAEQTPIVNAE